MESAENQIPPLPEVPSGLSEIQAHVESYEKLEGALKPDNHARIVWNNPENPEKTTLALVYLHGFTASQGEGDPLHRSLANKLGANLYLQRITGHGLMNRDKAQPVDEQVWLQSARHALAIGHQIGNKVILMGTSTGGTLALYLAAYYQELVHSLLLYSPLIGFADHRIHLLEGTYVNRVAGTLFRKLKLEKQNRPVNPMWEKYWYTGYRFEEVLALVRLIKKSMGTETFQRITQPLFLGYYYKSPRLQDSTVSVVAMLEMFDSVSIPERKKQKQSYPEAGNHVITSKFISPHVIDSVIFDSHRFIEKVATENAS